jgi:TonB family protein
MGPSITFAAACVALTIQAAAQIAPTLTPLKPSSPWNVEYADNMCLLQRAFGEPSQQVMLGFKPGILSDQMRVIIVRKGTEKNTIRGNAEISFDGAAPVTVRFAEGYIEGKGVRAMVVDLEDGDLAPLLKANQMRIHAGKSDLAFAPNAVAVAMKALEACEKDLLVTWGMSPADVAAMGTLAQHPKSLTAIFTTDDYPGSAIRNNEQGTAGVRFWIGTDGRVSDCQVVEKSGSKTLDDKTCAIIEARARYTPALNKNGEVIRSIGYQRIRWELPGY